MHRLTGPTVAAIALCITMFAANDVSARDPDGRYANSPLKQWFDQLASGKGLCCSFADGFTGRGLGHAGRQLSGATARRMGRRARRGSGNRAEPLRSCGGVAVSGRERSNADSLLPAGNRGVGLIPPLDHRTGSTIVSRAPGRILQTKKVPGALGSGGGACGIAAITAAPQAAISCTLP